MDPREQAIEAGEEILPLAEEALAVMRGFEQYNTKYLANAMTKLRAAVDALREETGR